MAVCSFLTMSKIGNVGIACSILSSLPPSGRVCEISETDIINEFLRPRARAGAADKRCVGCVCMVVKSANDPWVDRTAADAACCMSPLDCVFERMACTKRFSFSRKSAKQLTKRSMLSLPSRSTMIHSSSPGMSHTSCRISARTLLALEKCCERFSRQCSNASNSTCLSTAPLPFSMRDGEARVGCLAQRSTAMLLRI
eukprot:2226353-Rhodomonas_salina.1